MIPNGETLPEPFIFTLMGQPDPLDDAGDKNKAYHAPVGGNDAMVSYNARAGRRVRLSEPWKKPLIARRITPSRICGRGT
ncbi:Uncharacterised protein [Ewingella americana]|uniref:Uncharacterized protein n=1 Tax=Ewingella americana TaxID=41202 RepID=A0A377TFU4_9GAMM|nr:Uncharacterised protein [Ewingella americana]